VFIAQIQRNEQVRCERPARLNRWMEAGARSIAVL